MAELISFQTFSSLDDACAIATKLHVANIETEIVSSATRLDSVIIGNEYSDSYILRIRAGDFNKAHMLLYENIEVDPHIIPVGHPLHGMNDDELRNIVANADEWGPENYNIALALLKSRGVVITEDVRLQFQKQRVTQLSEKQPFNKLLLAVGYVAAFVPLLLNFSGNHYTTEPFHENFIWYFPGLPGLIIGWSILNARTTLPDGKRISPYSNAVVKNGLAIFLLNILSIFINAVLLLYYI